MLKFLSAFVLVSGLCVQFAAAGSPAPAVSLVQDGDCWVCLGDSITAANCYPVVLPRVFKHFHPDANFTVINSGMSGDQASDDPAKLTSRVLKYKPNVVSIMYGMNEAINAWRPVQDKVPATDKALIQERYRKALTYMVRTLKAQGVTVLLMSPTPTDPGAHSYFKLDRTVSFLRDCAGIMREVAQAEGAHYVPVQEEYVAFQEKLPAGIVLTADGVHPSSLGHYSIARSLWQYAGFDKPLGKAERVASPPTPSMAVSAALASRFVKTDAAGIELTLTAASAGTATATWSLGDLHKQEKLTLAAGPNTWTIAVPNDRLPARNGQSADLLVDVRDGNAGSLFIIDLCRTAVLHFKDDRVSGVVETDQDRPEGKRLATWEVQRLGESLLLNFEVFTKDIVPEGPWPFSRDGLNLMLDFRPTQRFADIGIDREVTQTFLNVREKPFFSLALRAWTGQGMDSAATAAGARTATGYTAQMLINESFDLHTPVKLSARDYVGLLVAVAEHPSVNGAAKLVITANQKNDQPVSLYANNLMILDLKNKLPDDQIITAHITGVTAP